MKNNSSGIGGVISFIGWRGPTAEVIPDFLLDIRLGDDMKNLVCT